MKTYNKFLDYYDKIVRSVNNPIEDEVEFLVEDCIKEYNPESKSILETACGTWLVAKQLQDNWYKVTGLDISEEMLERAKVNFCPPSNSPLAGGEHIQLILADMTDFDLAKQFDVVLCNYNSICHLLKWEQWQSFFEMANKHLEKDGLLVFDINTVYEFENITKEFAQFYSFGDDTVCLEMYKNAGIFEWLVKMFIKREDGKYDLVEEVVRENSFAISKIEKELVEKWFKVLEKIDYHYWEVTARSERVYFICKKI